MKNIFKLFSKIFVKLFKNVKTFNNKILIIKFFFTLITCYLLIKYKRIYQIISKKKSMSIHILKISSIFVILKIRIKKISSL